MIRFQGLNEIENMKNLLKKYSRAAGDLTQVKKVEAIIIKLG